MLSVLYGAAIGMFASSADFPQALEFLKGLHLGAAVWLPVKATCAFPLVYHYLNGIRHLVRCVYMYYVIAS